MADVAATPAEAARGSGRLRAAWFVARKDVRFLLRQRETLLWTFVMPPVFFFFIGTITGGFGARGAEASPIELRAPAEAGFLADHVARRLERQGFSVRRTTPPGATPGAGAVTGSGRSPSAPALEGEEREAPLVALPAGFTDSVLAGVTTRVELTPAGDSDLDADYDQVRVARAVYGTLGDVILAADAGLSPTAGSLTRVESAPPTLALEVRSAGARREAPTGFEQAIPGTMVMFTLLVLFTSGAVLLVIERRQGLLRRLASSPLPRGGVVLGKWGGRMALGAVQIAFAMGAGTLLFGMRWGPDLPMVLLVLAAWAALAAALGLLLGNLARTEGQAVALGVLGANLLAALGGCWWPIEVTPGWMQRLALFLPTGWAMDALHRLVSFEAGAASALPHVLVMAAAAAAAGWLATRTFRFA